MSQRRQFQDQRRASKDASSEASSPQDVYNSASGATAASTPAKRGVRHLSAAQLEKKRANDRDSQRAIRERTKRQIETLETRVRELESGEAYQQLHAIVKEKEALLVENEEIKSRLASVLAILQPIVDARAGELDKSSNRFDPNFQATQPAYGLSARTPGPASDHRPDAGDTMSSLDPMLADSSRYTHPGPAHQTTKSPAPVHYTQPGQWSHGDAASSHGEPQASHLAPPGYTNDDTLRPLKRGQHTQAPHASSIPTSPLPWPFPITPQDRSGTASSTQQEDSAIVVRAPEEPPPIHTQRPNNIRPTCHFDSIISDFATEASKRLVAGVPIEEVLGPADPDLSTFLYPNMPNNGSMITTLLMDILRTYSLIRGPPEKICCLMNMLTILRWYISPTLDNYNAMPEYVRPVEAQVRVPHPIWVDMLPWPAMRAKLVFCYPSLPLDNFFVPYTTTLSVNWPGDNDAWSCLHRPEGSATVHLTPTLRERWKQLRHYSLGVDFAKSLPVLADTCRIVDAEGRDVRS